MASKEQNWAGQSAIITGASSGIGLEFARALHKRGCNVVLVARRESLLEDLAQECNSIRPDSAKVLVCDLTKKTDLAGLVTLISSSEIDILVNNAGRGAFGLSETIPVDDETGIISLNVTAPVVLTNAILPQMKARKSGTIISVASIAGFQPLPYMATYSGSKAFNFYHALSLAYEMKRFGVRVCAVCPGPVDTEFAGVARMPGEPTGIMRDSAEAVVRESLKAVEKGKSWVVPCIRAKCAAVLCRALPITLTSIITERLLRGSLPGSKHAQ